tara:strand:- start:638 stop:835 length:198 start_codon:yes stop_codon:yes gene_type:complete
MKLQFIITNEMGVQLLMGAEDNLQRLIVNDKVLIDQGQSTEEMSNMLSFQGGMNPQSLLGLNDDS